MALVFPLVFFEWRWKAFEALPPLKGAQASQVDCYRAYVAGRVVRLTLGDAIVFIRQEAARMGYPREAPLTDPSSAPSSPQHQS